jgi:CRP-like cAMP-binding protein
MRMVDRLAVHAPISDQDHTALLGLPHSIRSFEPGSYLVRDGDIPSQCRILVSGYTIGHKMTGAGLRQIVSVQIPGDIIDLQNIYLDIADHNVQTLTSCKVAVISRTLLRTLASEHASIATALFASAMVDASIHREWMVNNGRRDARTRIAHLLCEFAARLDVRGSAPGQPYELPMTQEQVGDALGLTSVHVNRTLRALISDGLVVQSKRGITIPNWEALKIEADFNDRYHHLNQR